MPFAYVDRIDDDEGPKPHTCEHRRYTSHNGTLRAYGWTDDEPSLLDESLRRRMAKLNEDALAATRIFANDERMTTAERKLAARRNAYAMPHQHRVDRRRGSA